LHACDGSESPMLKDLVEIEELAGGLPPELELEVELTQTQMTQKPMLRAEVGMRVRCARVKIVYGAFVKYELVHFWFD